MENAREIVLDVLLSLEKEEDLSHRLLRNVLNKYDHLDTRDKGFIKRVTEGVMERRMELDYYLDQYSKLPVRKMKPLIRNLLRMSTYQILYMDAVPDSAACNEACKLADKRKFHQLKGFVNGILRRIAADKENLTLPDPQKDQKKWLCVKYSMPELITEEWLSEYGPELTERILKGLLEIRPVSLRISEKLSKDEVCALKKRLAESGKGMSQSPYDERGFLATELEGAESLEDFREGNLTVQDLSCVLAVKAAGIKEADLVIDACAAPGGKSILAAELTGPKGKVFCGDISEKKLSLICENISRMHQENVEVELWDARQLNNAHDGQADVLLLDVPCSGLGVIGKKRDIKYHASAEGYSELEALQKEILRGAWQCVKPGGILLYSTCTIREAENRGMVRWILENLPFEPVSLADSLPESIREGILLEKRERKEEAFAFEDCCVQILPGILDMDGFFFAKLRRKTDA
ncbi:MAG: 16S rRNA (cytosine(967)-C(5))-methyltransferase RsmB [Lachnospiraceae bacterium]|nr:16S rRNA (cytosine(967)-C(5))-methyltransferase RsmB [Lachnospiraceae bacterium]